MTLDDLARCAPAPPVLHLTHGGETFVLTLDETSGAWLGQGFCFRHDQGWPPVGKCYSVSTPL